jgi:beta-lactam-binding protein with PASTA domain/energy-coupling factor transporter ATP-binding protein EcfA2
MLKKESLEPWFDSWCLIPGGDWQAELAQGLRASKCCAVFVGPSDAGNWEREELRVALNRAAKDPRFRVFLVLLPGVPEPFDASTLTPFLSTRTWVDMRGGLKDSLSLRSLVHAIKGLPVGPHPAVEAQPSVCPYRGLQVFDEEHARFFFGRDAATQRLVEKLKQHSFLAVVGASGSGKSSLARAGLLPALRRGVLPGSEAWPIEVLRPGAHPLDTLAAHLVHLYPHLSLRTLRDDLAADPRTLRLLLAGRPEGHLLVIVVDQLEEIFTACRDEGERRSFILNLLYATAPEGQAVLIVTLRADFYQRCAAYPALAQEISTHQLLVGAMGVDGLRQSIEEPARRVGLEFEKGLVDRILDDVLNQPGGLPLLEHALLELWERRRGSLLTLEAYQESDGVEGALARRAEDIWMSFTPDQQLLAQRALLRLIQPGEGSEAMRILATMEELVTQRGSVEALEGVVRALSEARLVTVSSDEAGQPTVEVSHEALIRSWPRLQAWVDEDRQGLRVHRRLTEAAQEWLTFERDPGALYRGTRLHIGTEWADRHAQELNDLEREFLAAGNALEKKDLRRARRRGGLGYSLVTVPVVLLGVFLYYFYIFLNANVPAVAGQTSDQASSLVTKAGFKPVVLFQPSDTIPIGHAISTTPSGGRHRKHSLVGVLVSSGIPLPNLAGQDEAAARAALESKGLIVDEQQVINAAPMGKVVGTAPPNGSVSKGDHVGLLISSGIPTLMASPNSVTMPRQAVNSTTAPQAVSIANSGTGPLTVSSVALGGPDAADFAIANNSCMGASVAPQGICAVQITFTPTAAGARNAVLSIVSNAPQAPPVTLLGTGLAPTSPRAH